ncbi:uncharacterized protein LOC130753524 isoform X2 [Actinidia eriantha]|uniref:uncharacterized protein LOC130753524 isoform X2 n=1 Tax=Actinidia eriantha TaxID=165200 RepID=UPI00258D36D1|nr:uncharacterized protein LOC130753524 isoform X2 [Actinidia eriantha]
MFRSHRQNRTSKSGEKIEFKFSNFQAIQVPKGWDKLFVSVISVDTGKTIAKSSKAPVRNGNCQWTETLSESIWISQDDSIKALEECLFKFVVSMGLERSGILGEATVNMASYMSSKASVPVFLPLKKCNYGTILQVKIHCLTLRATLRDEEPKNSSSHVEEQNADHYEMESKSNGSDDSFSRNAGSPSSKDLGSTSHPGGLQSRETSFSASGSHHSFDSAEGPIGRENFSPINDLNGEKYNLEGGQDSISSLYSSPHSNYPAENPYHSNHSSFNSRLTGSGNHSQIHFQESAHGSSRVVASSSLINVGCSKNLLEAAEDTIEELRVEAKMWERNDRKLMLDLEILRKEFSDWSKKQADLEMELSAASTERDSLKKEVEQLKLMLEKSMLKQTAREDSTFQSKGAIYIRKELESEIKFQQELNASLALQFKRSQESNIELVTVLQELEETIEMQKVEIENLSALQLKFSDMENAIEEKLEENRSLLLHLQQMQESEKKWQVDLQLLEQLLEAKSNDTEKDCSQNDQTLLVIETEYKCKLSSKEKEIASLEAKLSEALINGQTDELVSTCGSKVDLIREIEALKEKLQELERDCSELTDENLELVLKLKDYKNSCTSFDGSSSELPDKLFVVSDSEVSELKSEVQVLREELKRTAIERDQLVSLESSKVLPDLVEQIQMSFYHVKKPWYNISSHVNKDFDSDLVSLVNFKNTDITTMKGWADSILDWIIGLNNLLEARIIQCEEVLKQGELEMKERNDDFAESQKKLEEYVLKENKLSCSIRELQNLNIDLEANLTGIEKELNEKRSAIEKFEADSFLKEDEIDFLRQCQGELEAQISGLEKEKFQLEENMEILLRESTTTSKCLDDLRNELTVLSGSADSHVSGNKILERNCSELESLKHELELRLLDMEKENTELSDCISHLEAQLKNTMDEKESCQVEIENSKSVASSLQDEIRRFGIETEMQKLDFDQKIQDMQNQMSESQEECENLQLANQKLQESAESLVEECSTLQKENGLLRKQKLELEEHCTRLETDLGESQKNSSDYSKRAEALEANLSEILEAFSLKEKSMTSEIDALLQENRNLKEKLVLLENLLNQAYSEKTTEVENLQREIELLKKQISATHDEKERIASEAVLEVSGLRASKTELEYALQEVQYKVKLTESDLDTVRTESELKVQGLLIELSAFRQNHELIVADHEKTLEKLQSYRKSEDKLKTGLNDLELKLTVSEYERQQLADETDNLKVQLQKVTCLQDEILALKNELNASKFEKEKLEASLQSVSGDCEELMAEKTAFLQKISDFETVISEFEEYKREKVALEEKLLRVESDVSARETCAQDAELKNELSRITSQFQSKIQLLEEEKGECLKRSQSLEEHLKSIEEQKKGDKYDFHDESPRASGVDHIAKVQLLENKLAQALEANNEYKIQLQRLSSEGRNNHAATLRKTTADSEVVAKERYERTKSSLETELRDLQERYLQMSLRYAEVEAEREDLVMQLKVSKNGKKWFS